MIFLTACGAGGFNQPILNPAPWGSPELVREEKSFNVTIYQAGAELDPDTGRPLGRLALATGTFDITLQGHGSGINNQLHVDTNYSISWNDIAEAGARAGHTNTIESHTRFFRTSLLPTYSSRTANITPIWNERTNSYDHPSYQFNINYAGENRGSTMRMGRKENGEWVDPARNISVPDGIVFCNEQLWHLIRGFTNVAPGGGIAIPINNMLENVIRGQSVAIPVAIQASGGVYGRRLSDPEIAFLANMYAGETTTPAFMPLDATATPTPTPAPEGPYTGPLLQIMRVMIGYSQDNPGPAHHFMMTAPGVYFRNGTIYTSRIILGYEHIVFDTDGNPMWHIVYTLTDYSVR